MKKYFLALVTFLLFACHENDKKTPTSSIDVGRDFIRATLDGNFTDAEILLLKDSQNIQIFESYKNYYTNLSLIIKEGYKKASYNINKYDDAKNDSVVIINYSNSYMKQPQNIKLVRLQNKWLIDFKYTTSDTANIK